MELFGCFFGACFSLFKGCLCRTAALGFIEGWFVAYSRFLSGLYKVSSGDQSMRRVGNLKYIYVCMYVSMYVCTYCNSGDRHSQQLL